MQLVSDIWYKVFYAATVTFNIVLLGLFGANRFDLLDAGVTNSTAVLAVLLLAYCISIYWLIKPRYQSVATLILGAVFSIVLMSGLTHANSGIMTILYSLGWVGVVVASGLFGKLIFIATQFYTIALLSSINNFELKTIPIQSWILLGASSALGFFAYFFWRRIYHNTEATHVSQLKSSLNDHQAQAEILIQSIADGIAMVNTDGKIILFNPAATKLTEWPAEDALGVNINSVLQLKAEDGKDLQPQQNPISTMFDDNDSVNSVLQLTTRNKKQAIISLVVTPVVAKKGDKPTGGVVVIRDISAARAEERRRADFISTASHEMRTPVAAIEGYLALAMNEKVSKIDVKARDYLKKAHSSTQHLGQLFQDLLTSAKAEDGRLSSHPQVVEMGDFLEQLTDSLRFSAKKKGLLVDYILGGAEDGTASKVVQPLYYVHVDPDRIREVVTNLFDNAVKYTEQGRVTIGLTGDANVVQLHIADTGAGIPKDDIPHLFQKFYRVDNSATRTIGGTGLGLFISKQIVKLYSGRIWVESEFGKGSTFFINLPRLNTQRASALQTEEASKPQNIG